MNILTTSDYSRFDTITGNRVINKKKIQKLTEDIKAGLNLLPYCPVIVYRDQDEEGFDKLMIVDGQHRYETSRTNGYPVYYVICEQLDLKQIARLNSRSDKWSNADFLKCYIKLGIKDYKTLQEFMSQFGIIYSASIELLMNGNVKSAKNTMEIFRDGEFKVNHLEEAEKVASLTIDIFSRYNFRSDRYLIQAMQELMNDGRCDFDTLKQKIAAAPMLMSPQTSYKEYIYNIERVYNHNNQKRQVIF